MKKNIKIIQPKTSYLDLNLNAVWQYRDLLFIFVKRDYSASYKQTILGPLWHILQPIFPTIMYTFVFGKVAKISTDGVPQPLFYLSGLVLWNYFSDCFSRTSNVFVTNASMFGKVYFPRLVTPLSYIISSLMRFTSQFILFLIILFYYILVVPTSSVGLNHLSLIFPFILFTIAGYSLGLGLIASSLSSKYRDLAIILGFFISLLQYATCIIYPMSAVPEQYKFIVQANPLSHLVEAFRYGFLGHGELSSRGLSYSFIVMLIVLFTGLFAFNKVQRTVMDTI